MNTKMTLRLALLVLAAATVATASAKPAASNPMATSAMNDIGWNLALDRTVPGKGGWTTCYQYATGLQKKFTQAGGESHVVVYNWTASDTGTRGCHAFLVYRDAAGQYWGVDALADRPRWLRGSTPPEWATFWDADKNIQVIADYTDKRLKGKWANGPA